VKRVELEINNRPMRKCGYLFANEVFYPRRQVLLLSVELSKYLPSCVYFVEETIKIIVEIKSSLLIVKKT
jgi:hypothetical protein